jgi:glycosyltransferase involved in cell wall biosynthesis
MRIAFISQYFYPEQYFHNAIAADLVKKGHEVHAVACVPNYGQNSFFKGYSNTKKRSETWKGVVIDRAWTVARGKSRFRLSVNYLVYPLTASWTAARKLQPKPDVSFVSLPSPVLQAFVGVFLKKFRKVPTVYWVLDIWPESVTYTLNLHHPIFVKPLHWVCGWLYRQADHVLVQSKGFIPMITRFGVPQSRVSVLSNTASSFYRPLSPKEAPEEAKLIPQSGFRLVFAGNIGASQDFDTLMEAARILKPHEDISWIIIGSGRGLERVKEQVRQHGLESRVWFLGRYPEERMPYFFAHADAMLVSLKDTPIFALTVPAKLQSYMACGKPVIASLAGEGAHIVEESNAGLAVPPSSPDKLAVAILKMKSLPKEQREQYGTNALHYFQANFSQDILHRKLGAVLQEVAQRRG